jgi:hypothetical protein
MENQRQYYRIRYPETERPNLLAAGVYLPILDLSETGACCLGESLLFDDSASVAIQIVFRDGKTFSTAAKLVRRDQNSVAVQFSPSVPLRIILAEQLRLQRMFLEIDRQEQ